jgi:hypothetical protein
LGGSPAGLKAGVGFADAVGTDFESECRIMNRQHTLRALRRNLRIWQTAAVACVALLLLGAGGLTMSSLRVSASDTTGEKVRMSVGTEDVFVIDGDDKDARVNRLRIGPNGPLILSGTGAPMIAAPNGSLYLQTDGNGALFVRIDDIWEQASTGS